MNVILDLCIVPIGVGVSLSPYVAACEKVLKEAVLEVELWAGKQDLLLRQTKAHLNLNLKDIPDMPGATALVDFLLTNTASKINAPPMRAAGDSTSSNSSAASSTVTTGSSVDNIEAFVGPMRRLPLPDTLSPIPDTLFFPVLLVGLVDEGEDLGHGPVELGRYLLVEIELAQDLDQGPVAADRDVVPAGQLDDPLGHVPFPFCQGE